MCLRRGFGYSQASSISGHVGRRHGSIHHPEVVRSRRCHFPASKAVDGAQHAIPAGSCFRPARPGTGQAGPRPSRLPALEGSSSGQRPDPVSTAPHFWRLSLPTSASRFQHTALPGFPDGARYPASVRQPLPQSLAPLGRLLIDLCAALGRVHRTGTVLPSSQGEPARQAPAAGPGPARDPELLWTWMSPPRDWIPGRATTSGGGIGRSRPRAGTVVLTTHYMDKRGSCAI